MTGAHHSTTQSPFVNVRKSAIWLGVLAVLILLPVALLALLAFGIYLATSDDTGELSLLTIGLVGTAFLVVIGDLAGALVRRRSAPRRTTRVISDACVLSSVAVSLAADNGHRLGWYHGAFPVAVTGLAGMILIGYAAYWLGGRRRLLARMKARAAARQER